MQIDENYRKAAQFIQSAASQGAQLAVLPEYCLTNWLPDDPKFREIVGQSESYLQKFQALAKQHKINLVPGTIVERANVDGDEEGDDRLVNNAYFIDDQGDILGTYQKKNLWYTTHASQVAGHSEG